MSDAISSLSSQRIAALYPGLRPLAFRVLQDALSTFNKPMNVVQGMRSMDEQFTIYKQGREFVEGTWIVMDRSKIVTNARPGLSYHNYGLAFDCAFAGSDPYMKQDPEHVQQVVWARYGEILKHWGLGWGGDFRLKNGSADKPHAELSYGLQIHECLELWSQGGIKALWAHIDQIRGVEIGSDWKQPSI